MGFRSGAGSGRGEHEPEEHDGQPDLRAQFRATRSDIERQMQATRAQFDATNEKIAARTGRNLLGAIAIGLLLGGGFFFSLILDKALFMLVAAVLLGVSAFELAGALRTAGRVVSRVPAVIGALGIIPAAFFGGPAGQLAGLAGALVLVCVWRVVACVYPRYRVPARELLADLTASVLVQVYVGFLGSFAVLLTSRDGGQWWTLAFVIVVICVDIGAYASGLMFGKHPMAPVISPKKTWEGFAGAAAASVIAGVLLAVLMLGEPWWFGVVFGLALLGTATMGDLIESLIKRDIGIKDMSSWLPGHGGFLDRLDSILPSAALAYALFVIF